MSATASAKYTLAYNSACRHGKNKITTTKPQSFKSFVSMRPRRKSRSVVVLSCLSAAAPHMQEQSQRLCSIVTSGGDIHDRTHTTQKPQVKDGGPQPRSTNISACTHAGQQIPTAIPIIFWSDTYEANVDTAKRNGKINNATQRATFASRRDKKRPPILSLSNASDALFTVIH